MLPTRVFLAITSACGRAARVFEALAAGTLTRQQLRAGIAAGAKQASCRYFAVLALAVALLLSLQGSGRP